VAIVRDVCRLSLCKKKIWEVKGEGGGCVDEGLD
jgi:hypothetical protein